MVRRGRCRTAGAPYQILSSQAAAAILDATINGGRFWRGSRRKVIGLDIDPRHRAAVCGDNALMPFVPGRSTLWSMTLPTFPTRAATARRTSIGASGSEPALPAHGYSFTHTYLGFMAEAAPRASWRSATSAYSAPMSRKSNCELSHIQIGKIL